MRTTASQITSLTIVYWTVYSGADQRKHQSSASLAFRGIHRGPVNSPHKGSVTRKMFSFDDVIMNNQLPVVLQYFRNNTIMLNVGVLWQIYEIIYYWYVKISRCGYMEHGWKCITFYVQKHIAPLAMCYNPPLVHDMPLGMSAFVKLVSFKTISRLINTLSINTSSPMTASLEDFLLTPKIYLHSLILIISTNIDSSMCLTERPFSSLHSSRKQGPQTSIP